MGTDKVHIRHCMLYEFQQGKTASQATETICSVLGAGVLNVRTCQRWYSRFEQSDFDLSDKEHTGRKPQMEPDELQALLDEDACQSTRELAEKLGVSQPTVVRRLHDMGKIQKSGRWVPHTLSEVNINQRLTTCISLLARYRKKNFFWKLVTGDEKWIYYENPVNKKQWLDPCQPATSIPKPDIHGKKNMLCAFWDSKGMLYYEVLEPFQTVDGDLYRQQLRRLRDAIDEKRPSRGHGRRKVILLHDNARPHVAISTHETIMDLGWEVLPHPAYSPDLAPSDFHLYRSLKHFLEGKKFNNKDDIQNQLHIFFTSKPQSFFYDGIHQLPLRWQKVIENNGNYFDDKALY